MKTNGLPRAIGTTLILGCGIFFSLATSAPNLTILGSVELGTIVIDEVDSHQVHGHFALTDAARSFEGECTIGYSLSGINASASSGVLHLWQLEAPFDPEHDQPLEESHEPVQSVVVRGALQGDESGLLERLVTPCAREDQPFFFALTMEGEARVEANADFEVMIEGRESPPEDASISIQLEAP